MELLIALEIALILAVIGYFVINSLFRDQYKVIEELKNKGNYQEALSKLLKLFQKNKDDVRIIYELAEVNKQLGNHLEAIGYYLNLLEKDVFPPITTKGEVLKNVGLLFLEEKKFKEAFYYLYYASYFLPSDKDINHSLFKILLQEENYQLSDTFGQRALPFYSKDFDFITDLAFVKLQLNKYGDAIELLEKVSSVKSIKVKVMLAFTLLKLGGYRRALDIISPTITEEGIPDLVMCLIYKIIIFCHIRLKNFNDAMNYWDQFLTFATSKNLGSVIREIGFGIFMTYLYFYKYDSAKELLPTLKEYEISDAVINSISPFIDEAINSMKLKKEMKTYDIRPIKEIENFAESWLNSSLRVGEIKDVFYPRKQGERIDVISLIKEVQEEITKHNKKVDSFIEGAGEGLVEDVENVCDMFTNRLDSQTFMTICDELVKALGFNIIRKVSMDTFIESEGMDYICSKPKEKEKYFVAIRRWGSHEIGKIAIVDINQKASENGCEKVLIISSAPLTSEAQDYVDKNSRIEFKTCKEVAGILKTIIPSV